MSQPHKSRLTRIVNGFINREDADGYLVSMCFKDAEYGGTLPKLLTSYALRSVGAGALAPGSGGILKLLSKGVRKLYGGIYINGSLLMAPAAVEFTPLPGSSLFVQGIEKLVIPYTDIKSVRKESYLLITKAVYIDTAQGEIKLVTNSPYMGFSDSQNICDELQAKLTG